MVTPDFNEFNKKKKNYKADNTPTTQDLMSAKSKTIEEIFEKLVKGRTDEYRFWNNSTVKIWLIKSEKRWSVKD